MIIVVLVSLREGLIAGGVLEPLVNLLNVANPKIQLRTLEVIDGFGGT